MNARSETKIIMCVFLIICPSEDYLHLCFLTVYVFHDSTNFRTELRLRSQNGGFAWALLPWLFEAILINKTIIALHPLCDLPKSYLSNKIAISVRMSDSHYKSNWSALVDPKEGGLGTRSPSPFSVQFLSFSFSFWQNSCFGDLSRSGKSSIRHWQFKRWILYSSIKV